MKPGIWKVAHRGASGETPENTIASFKKALVQGAEVIETDARLSKDGAIVLIHDETIERTTDGKGRVCELTLEELKGLDAGSWFAEEFFGERIPTLAEAIDAARGKVKLDIELKGRDPLLPEKVVSLLEENDFIKETIISSFNCSFLEEVKKLNPEIITGLLFATIVQEREWKWADIILPRHNLITENLIKKVHSKGLKVIAWTVDSPEKIKKLINLGVDGIASNYPALLTEILK